MQFVQEARNRGPILGTPHPPGGGGFFATQRCPGSGTHLRDGTGQMAQAAHDGNVLQNQETGPPFPWNHTGSASPPTLR